MSCFFNSLPSFLFRPPIYGLKKRIRRKFATIFCAVFRHSHIVTNCMWYKNCGRCGEQLGDQLMRGLQSGPGGYFQAGQSCKCSDCRQAFETLTWLDRFMAPKAEWPTMTLAERRALLDTMLPPKEDA